MTPEPSYRNNRVSESACERMRQARMAHLPMDEVKDLYAKGMNMRSLASMFGVHINTISRHLRAHGVTARRHLEIGKRWGEAHHMWKGDNASVRNFHRRLHRRKGLPKHCEECGTSDPRYTYDWANLTGNYKDMDDYKRMCRKCHRQYDKQRRGADWLTLQCLFEIVCL